MNMRLGFFPEITRDIKTVAEDKVRDLCCKLSRQEDLPVVPYLRRSLRQTNPYMNYQELLEVVLGIKGLGRAVEIKTHFSIIACIGDACE